MRFERRELAAAVGCVLGHNAADDTGRRALRKGKARRIAEVVVGEQLRRSRALTGRVNVYPETRGVLRVDLARLERLNMLPGLALATLAHGTAVPLGKMVATLKIIPYALPETVVRGAEELATGARRRSSAPPVVRAAPSPTSSMSSCPGCWSAIGSAVPTSPPSAMVVCSKTCRNGPSRAAG